MRRLFNKAGVEIECLFRSYEERSDAIDKIERMTVSKDKGCYAHNDGSDWVIGRDSSLMDGERIYDGDQSDCWLDEDCRPEYCSDCDYCHHRRDGDWCCQDCYGLEVSSPAISWADDEFRLSVLSDVLEAITDNDGYVNFSCGSHVHFSADEVPTTYYRRLLSDTCKRFWRLTGGSMVSPNMVERVWNLDENKTSVINPKVISTLQDAFFGLEPDRSTDIDSYCCRVTSEGGFTHYSWLVPRNVAGLHYEIRLFSGTLSLKRVLRNIAVGAHFLNLAVDASVGGKDGKNAMRLAVDGMKGWDWMKATGFQNENLID